MTDESEPGGPDRLSQQLHEAHARFLQPLRPEPAIDGDVAPAPGIQAPPPAPSLGSWDWRSRGVISTPSSQHPCNACTSFAISAAIEAALAIRGQPPRRVDPGYLHTCVAHGGKIVNADEDCRRGADLGRTLAAVKVHGYAFAPDPNVYPFPVAKCSAAAVHTIAGYTLLTGLNSTKAAIEQSPVVAEMWIWKNFFDYRGQTPTYVPDPNSGSQQLHSVCLIGFDNIGWIIKNSFGLEWGSKGFATIAYGTCGLCTGPLPGESACETYSIGLT